MDRPVRLKRYIKDKNLHQACGVGHRRALVPRQGSTARSVVHMILAAVWHVMTRPQCASNNEPTGPIFQYLGRGGISLILVPVPSCSGDDCDFAVSNMAGGDCQTCPLCNRCVEVTDEVPDELEIVGLDSDMVSFCAPCGITFDCCCSIGDEVFHAKFITAVVDRKTGEQFEGMPVFRRELDSYLLLRDTWRATWTCTCRGACGELSRGRWGGQSKMLQTVSQGCSGHTKMRP
jgi:hypothetical protein